MCDKARDYPYPAPPPHTHIHTHMRERTHTNGFCPIYMTVFVVVAVYVEKLLGLKFFTF